MILLRRHKELSLYDNTLSVIQALPPYFKMFPREQFINSDYSYLKGCLIKWAREDPER